MPPLNYKIALAILGDFASEVEKRMDALLSIQNERVQREFDYLKSQLENKN